jgi:hypothetical protein
MYLLQRNSTQFSDTQLLIIFLILVAVIVISIYDYNKYMTLGFDGYEKVLARRIRWLISLTRRNNQTETICSNTNREISEKRNTIRIENVPVNERGDTINIVIRLTILDNSESSEE